MADGSRAFNFPPPQTSRLRDGEIVVDLFAGGGGASEALKQALGIDPALAYNHDQWAIGMHAANHPMTIHHREDIWHADPVKDVAGRLVGWFHASPDCTHFSQAKGGQPRNRKIRALSWVVLKWVGQLAKVDRAPRIISMENVWQILTWGPLVAKRCKATGRVLKMDGTVAAKGERVPVENQQLVPDKRYIGRTWQQFVAALRAHGYVVEWRKLVASDYGAGTSRERLFLLARRDGEAIRWPEPTHKAAPVCAADSIDFSDLGRSIFDRPRPLATATLRRIAKGVMKHVLQAKEPFFLTEFANAGNGGRTWSAMEPLRTQCAGVKGGHFAMVAPTLAVLRNNMGGARIDEPLRTISAGGEHHALISPALVKFKGDSIGHPITDPVPTITAGGDCKRPAGAAHSLAVMSAFLAGVGGRAGQTEPRPVSEPHYTITAKADCGVVAVEMEARRCAGCGTCAPAPGLGDLCRDCWEATEPELRACLTPEQEASALRVAAFLVNYYGNGTALNIREPLDTVTTHDRMALVTVYVQGTPYVIVDIKLRMLKPAELFRAQGFPPGYVIDRTADGRPISNTHAVRMVGNSVSPPPLRALAEANLDRAVSAERLVA